MSANFLGTTVEQLIKKKFGLQLGNEVINAVNKCIKAVKEGTDLLDCVVKEISTYSEVEKQAVWDFLYHFVIVG